MPGNPDECLASMGIYIFNTKYLFKLLEDDLKNKDSTHDFGKDIIPTAVKQNQAFAHPFDMSCVPQSKTIKPYWKDVGTLEAFWAANLDLAADMPELNMYDSDWPIWTAQSQLPPAKFVPNLVGDNGKISNVLVSGGCIVLGSNIDKTVMFSNVTVASDCNIDQSVILPGVTIGENCSLSKVIIDRGCEIPTGMVIGKDAILDAKRFLRTENGVVLVTKKYAR